MSSSSIGDLRYEMELALMYFADQLIDVLENQILLFG
jgi:hypothetical protein